MGRGVSVYAVLYLAVSISVDSEESEEYIGRVAKNTRLAKTLTIRLTPAQLAVVDRIAQREQRKRADVARRLLMKAIEAEAVKS